MLQSRALQVPVRKAALALQSRCNKIRHGPEPAGAARLATQTAAIRALWLVMALNRQNRCQDQPESFKSPRIIDTCELAVKSRVSSGAGSAENESDKLPGPLMAYRACL